MITEKKILGENEQLSNPQGYKFSEELKKMDYEPLLPIEKKLIVWSIGLGILTLGFLVVISRIFFPRMT